MPKSSPTRPFSMRLPASTIARLEARSRQRGEPKTRLAADYVEEGLRMEAHPGVLFRTGPAGRRAALATGPDVWEVVRSVKNSGANGDEALRAAIAGTAVSIEQATTALGYYGEHRGEIDAWLRRVDEEAEAAERAWRRQQAALA